MNKKYEANRVLEIFSDTRKSSRGLNTSSRMHFMSHNWSATKQHFHPQSRDKQPLNTKNTALPTAKSAKLKISHWFSLIFVFSLSSLHLRSTKSTLSRALFTHSQPFDEMFIFCSKSCCGSGTFTNVLFTSLLTKNAQLKYKLFWDVYIEHSLSYIVWNFHPSSSRMRVINHNWSATKQLLHPQSVAEISRHSVLSGDRIRQCETSSGSRHKDTDQCL